MTTTKFCLSDWVDEAIADIHGREVLKTWLIDKGYDTPLALSLFDPLAIPNEIQSLTIKEGWVKALITSVKLLADKLIKLSSGK